MQGISNPIDNGFQFKTFVMQFQIGERVSTHEKHFESNN